MLGALTITPNGRRSSSPPGIWSSEKSENGTSSPKAHDDSNTPSEDEAAPKDEKLTWPFIRFSELAKTAKGRVTTGMLQFIRKHLKGTRLIFVVGLSGAGKTTLLGEITNQKLEVGHSVKSGTLGYEVLPTVVHGEQYLFVDTPGFGAQDLDDKKVYEDIMNCVCTLGQWVTIAGVMFVHSMRSADWLAESEMKTIRWLITEDDMDQARAVAKELEDSAFRSILSPEHVKGGRLYRHGVEMSDGHDWDVVSMMRRRGERVSMAADFIRDHYERSDGVARLQVLEELSRGCGLYETEAAASLFNTFSSSTICVLRQKALIMDVDEELKPKVQKVEGGTAPSSKLLALKENAVADPNVSAMRWWEIAKEVAWTFWGFRRTGNTKFTEYRRSTAADAWEKLKTWWSGEAPPQ
ncbi:hypothetical protein BDV19DRAFT_395802 [Aspergillus venezuelensis]